MSADDSALAVVVRLIAPRLRSSTTQGPLVVGLCGAQGSGKSTLAARLETHFNEHGTPTAILSIDDLYRTLPEREALARDVHPLLYTRGVPGTHDVALGLAICDGLDRRETMPLPRFDKARDDRAPRADWDEAAADTRLLILEGWCVGARPQDDAALVEPVNALESAEDPDGIWRRYVNAQLAGEYQTLFDRLDLLILLAAPGFEIVQQWRTEQEQTLRARTGAGMSDDAIARFIAHYERLTRHILVEMPQRAKLVIRLARDRTPLSQWSTDISVD